MQAQTSLSVQWHDVCSVDDLVTNSGVCALIAGIQVAIFSVQLDGETNVYAISNWDPIGEANVLYRGIVGTLTDKIVVASPLYKEHYDLDTGKCLEREDASVSTYPVRVDKDRVFVEL
ncbi:nitrite reductase small subunit NirD [Alteromonas lipolytica]|uniref:Nitrite reductase small subunit n=1 Tax=Alteromonas lipolytica TaxID=1856405 RepID=A0A1E8FKA9_9ALTE|nr:nitrite reductase small subunit NirD [Alteromonas lipolytica]OFI36355.1 nitrite reductase small subunit [Alteromonas lipolytica]GGF70578.1 nitrite reductase small subunit [Alteromonas lipolytica]